MKIRFLIILFISLFAPVESQSEKRRMQIAVLDFGDSIVAKSARDTVVSGLGAESELNLLDKDQARSAARGSGYLASLNMSVQEARSLGESIGCDYYFIGDVQTLRRSPSTGAVYFESYASIFIVSSRTGRLLSWERPSFQAPTGNAAEKLLLDRLANTDTQHRYLATIRRAQEEERMHREIVFDNTTPVVEVAPDDEKVAELQGLRLPRPYRRLVPPYPETAAKAEAEGTVDVLANLDANGEVIEVELARWAGFGLDEATVDTVKRLHFFPAMRKGTAIPLRVLLRYNFRKPAR